MPNRRPAPPPRPALRVAVTLTAPWAVAEDLCLEGVEVSEVRRYAHWLGRELQWQHVPPEDLVQALADDRVDLAIGGLRATTALLAVARLANFSEQRLARDECPRGTGYRHVWAVRRHRWRDWAAVRAYLQVVRHRPGASGHALIPAGAESQPA